MGGKTSITRYLPDNEYQAAISSNAPSSLNPFATIADITASSQNLQQVMDVGSSATVGTVIDISTTSTLFTGFKNVNIKNGISANIGSVSFKSNNLTTNKITEIAISSIFGTVLTDDQLTRGMKYGADYSVNGIANYGDRWIPDYGTVTNQIGGKSVSALVKAPLLAQDGFAVTWDNTAGQYTLTSIGADGNGIYTGSGSLSSPTTVSYANINSLTFTDGGTSTPIKFNSNGGIVVNTSDGLTERFKVYPAAGLGPAVIIDGVTTMQGNSSIFNITGSNSVRNRGTASFGSDIIAASSAWYLDAGTSNANVIQLNATNGFDFWTFNGVWTKSMIIQGTTGTGRVGIGTIPTGHLHIKGGDVKFEGLTDTNLFVAKYSTDRVGIGTNTPASKLTVAGDIETVGNGLGLIVADAVTGTRYRVYMNNGVLTTQLA